MVASGRRSAVALGPSRRTISSILIIRIGASLLLELPRMALTSYAPSPARSAAGTVSVASTRCTLVALPTHEFSVLRSHDNQTYARRRSRGRFHAASSGAGAYRGHARLRACASPSNAVSGAADGGQRATSASSPRRGGSRRGHPRRASPARRPAPPQTSLPSNRLFQNDCIGARVDQPNPQAIAVPTYQ